MDSARFVQLISELVSQDAQCRDDGAEHAFDLRSALALDEAHAVAVLLAHLSVTETRAEVRESLLHALADFVEWSRAPAAVADMIAATNPSTMLGSEIEYVSSIRNPLAGAPSDSVATRALMRDDAVHPALAGVVLDESYVLAVTTEPGLVTFEMDFALASDHVDHSLAEASAPYAVRTGRLVFSDVTSLRWTGQGAPPATDASGERDYGNIDSLEWDGGRYVLEGDWGQMQVDAGQVEIVLTP